MERNLKQHHFSCDLRITMSCITVYSITDSQRTSIKSIFFLALGSRALLQTTQEQSSRIFSPSTGKDPFFPVFVFFRLSLKQQPNHTFIFPRPVRLPKAFTMDLRERPRKQQLPWQDAELNSLPLPLQQRRLQHAPRRKHLGVNRVNRVV